MDRYDILEIEGVPSKLPRKPRLKSCNESPQEHSSEAASPPEVRGMQPSLPRVRTWLYGHTPAPAPPMQGNPMSLGYTARNAPALGSSNIIDAIEMRQPLPAVPEESIYNQHSHMVADFNDNLASMRLVSHSVASTSESEATVDTFCNRDGRAGHLCNSYGRDNSLLASACSTCFSTKQAAHNICILLTRGELRASAATTQLNFVGNISADALEYVSRVVSTHNTECPLYGTDYKANDPSCNVCRQARPCNFHTNPPPNIRSETSDERNTSFVSSGIVRGLFIYIGISTVLAIILSFIFGR